MGIKYRSRNAIRCLAANSQMRIRIRNTPVQSPFAQPKLGAYDTVQKFKKQLRRDTRKMRNESSDPAKSKIHKEFYLPRIKKSMSFAGLNTKKWNAKDEFKFMDNGQLVEGVSKVKKIYMNPLAESILVQGERNYLKENELI